MRIFDEIVLERAGPAAMKALTELGPEPPWEEVAEFLFPASAKPGDEDVTA